MNYKSIIREIFKTRSESSSVDVRIYEYIETILKECTEEYKNLPARKEKGEQLELELEF